MQPFCLKAIGISLVVVFCSCKKLSHTPSSFVVHNAKETGLQFSNTLTATVAFNLFDYMYFYNGAGIGAGDFNNDGKIDLFFASNQSQNKLFINRGGLQFTDETQAAGIPNDGSWSTGVSVVDINQDGFLDIYVCRVGQYAILKGKNQLLICTGIDARGVPHYQDRAAEYGLDFSGFSTQAVFADIDQDGDLDLFLLNHSVHQNGNFAPRANFLQQYSDVSGNRIYENVHGKYVEITQQTGIQSSNIGYGLGVCAADINLDGYLDFYVGNDFQENDYLYLNQKNKTFKDAATQSLMHTSQYSMGVEVADVTNDALPDIFSMDMLPADPYILKRSLGEDEQNTFDMKIKYGYQHQYTRNNFQWNRGNGHFSEIGLYAGIAATDWSWAVLAFDFDNDGKKDIFMTNGIPKRMNDIDYVNYVSDFNIKEKMKDAQSFSKEMAVINGFPEIKIKNKLFKNVGQARFEDMESRIINNQPSFSNGCIYADLDNDGDLDLVTNDINSPAMLYENTLYTSHTADSSKNNYLSIALQGPPLNKNAIGAKLIVYQQADKQLYEKCPVRGFLSSMEIPIHIGLEKHRQIDSILLIWPNNTYQKISPAFNQTLHIAYTNGLPVFDYTQLQPPTEPNHLWKEITQAVGLHYKHIENPFNEFDRELLIPRMTSREGPALAIGDLNGDHLDDIFIGGSKTNTAALFIQQKNGTFLNQTPIALLNDSIYEDVDAVIADFDQDGKNELVVASGGSEYYGKSVYLQSRLYRKTTTGNWQRDNSFFNEKFINAATCAVGDFNHDGYLDIFIGAKSVSYQYGVKPSSILLKNMAGKGFEDVTNTYLPDLKNGLFINKAVWVDIDNDGDLDLVLATEWDGIIAFVNTPSGFTKRYLTTQKGWWSGLRAMDLNGDGKMDLVLGNLGRNNRFTLNGDKPIKMYYNDFDKNGTSEQALTYTVSGRNLVFANKDEIQKQLPFVKKKFLYAKDFAKATPEQIFGEKPMEQAAVFEANYFNNAVLLNKGNLEFDLQALPWPLQISPLYDFENVDQQHAPSIMAIGNFYPNNIEMGRYDASYGALFKYGTKGMTTQALEGVVLQGEARWVKPIIIKGSKAFVVAFNNDSLRIFSPPH